MGESKLRTRKLTKIAEILKLTLLGCCAVVLSLALFDGVLIALGVFPPRTNPGHSAVGWISASPRDSMFEEWCTENETGARRSFRRNEDGLRTSFSAGSMVGNSDSVVILVGGDSHTDLCAPNGDTHFGVMEEVLGIDGIKAKVAAFGAGRYSPLQAYLAVEPFISKYGADVFVLNLYTGNDLYDLLRVDDRPHFVKGVGGYELHPPIWYEFDDPAARPKSRVLYAVRQFAEATGVRRQFIRVSFLREAARQQGQGLSSVTAYLNDLRKATSDQTGYPQAFIAQMLNQQLFFHHFDGSEAESLRRVDALLALIREKNPTMTLVLSPLPSYQLIPAAMRDSSFIDVLDRLPITTEGSINQENRIYDSLHEIAERNGWAFVDNREILQAASDSLKLFNKFDYHLEPDASELIGRHQAKVILPLIRGH